MFRLAFILLAAVLAVACSDDRAPTTPTSTFSRPYSGEREPGGARAKGETVDTAVLESCALIEQFRVSANVSGTEVEVDARIDGTAVDGTRGRVIFWPLGRHVGPRVVSDLIHTGNSDDFPIETSLSYDFLQVTEPADYLANVDFELLNACYEPELERFVLGSVDASGACIPGESFVLQCDRGVAYHVEP
jgi:hypothetical protein